MENIRMVVCGDMGNMEDVANTLRSMYGDLSDFRITVVHGNEELNGHDVLIEDEDGDLYFPAGMEVEQIVFEKGNPTDEGFVYETDEYDEQTVDAFVNMVYNDCLEELSDGDMVLVTRLADWSDDIVLNTKALLYTEDGLSGWAKRNIKYISFKLDY